MKYFKINDELSICCEYKKTRSGFKHIAELESDRLGLIESVKVCYMNRTWERFEFETVIEKLLDKSEFLKEHNLLQDKEERKAFLNHCEKKTDNPFKFIAAIAQIGAVMSETQKEKNDFQKRIIAAGLGNSGISFPEDWDTLTEDEKEKRLDGAINLIK